MEKTSEKGDITGVNFTTTGTTHIYETNRVTSSAYDGGCISFVPVDMSDGSQDKDRYPVFGKGIGDCSGSSSSSNSNSTSSGGGGGGGGCA